MPKLAIRWLLPGFIFMLQMTFAEAQTLAFKHLGVADGLPSSFLYDIVQAKDGFIWIATEGGVCKYDGHRFEKVNLEESSGPEIIDLFVDSRNRLWMLDLATQINYLQEGKLHSIPLEKYKSDYSYIQFFEDSKRRVWLANRYELFCLKGDTIDWTSQKNYADKPYLEGLKLIRESADGSILILNNYGLTRIEEEEHIFYPYTESPGVLRPKVGFVEEGDLYFINNSKLYRYAFTDHQLLRLDIGYSDWLESGIIFLIKDRQGTIWMSTKSGILRIRKTASGTFQVQSFLEGMAMGAILEDHEGNLWFTTQQNGIYILASDQVEIVKEKGKENQVSVLHLDENNQIVQGLSNGDVRIYDEQRKLQWSKNINSRNTRIYDIEKRPSSPLYVMTSKGLYTIDEDRAVQQYQADKSFKCARFGPGEQLWIGSSRFIGRYKNTHIDTILHKRTYAVLPAGQKTWIGTTEGLYTYENGSCSRAADTQLHIDIKDIQLGPDSMLWLATRSHGLILSDGENLKRQFRIEEGMLSNNCYKIAIGDKYAWVATNKGINRVRLADYTLLALNMDDGLPSNEVNDLLIQGDQIVAASNNGMAVFKENFALFSDPPIVHFTGIKIQERDTLVREQYELKYWQNNIKVAFIGIAFRHASDLTYQYQMEGLDQQWIQSSLNIAQYPSLPPGMYRFRLRAKTINSGWSEEQAIQFYIATPFWQQWWFYLLTFLAVFLLAGKLTQVLIRDFKARNAIRENLKESRLTALRSQMNPHFIFNALNSIQEFIIREDKRAANHYLTHFSKLMRSILNMSDKEEISLTQEIDALNLYLELEALRFDEQLQYHIEIDSGIQPGAVHLPSMLLQPYVENAIKHGLLHRKGDKKLYIRFRKEGEYLVCEVEDNGVGRAAVNRIQQKNNTLKESRAMSLTQERLFLLNSARKDKLSVVLTDLKKEDGTAKGTLVRIFIKYYSKK